MRGVDQELSGSSGLRQSRLGTVARQNHLFSFNVCSSVSVVLIRHLYLVGHMAAWIQGIFPGSLEIRCGIAAKFRPVVCEQKWHGQLLEGIPKRGNNASASLLSPGCGPDGRSGCSHPRPGREPRSAGPARQQRKTGGAQGS